MISTGITVRQRTYRAKLNGSGGVARHALRDQIKHISAIILGSDTKPSTELGERPELMWLPKNLLYVDERYQRETAKKTSRRLIRKLVEDFSWSKFQPITVRYPRSAKEPMPVATRSSTVNTVRLPPWHTPA